MIRMQQLSLYRGSKPLILESDLDLHSGWKVGITGANGCGKSSLLALVRGELTADHGSLSIAEGWQIAHVAQETPASEQSALDYVLDGDDEYRKLQRQIVQEEASGGHGLGELHAEFESIDGYNAPHRAGKLLSGLGFKQEQHSQPVRNFSGGWRMRLNLAQALLSRSDLLLLDEPTNHLDLDTTFWLQDWINAYKGTLLLISHDREFLDEIVDHTINISHQKALLYSGNYSQFEQQRAARLMQQQSAYEKQQRDREQMHRFIERFKAKASKAKQAQSRVKALERMEELLPAHVDSQFHFSFLEPHRLPAPLLDLEEGAIGYGSTSIASNISLRIHPGDRIALLGHNGAGKTTLIKTLCGEQELLAGQIKLSAETRIGYFAQHQLEQLDVHATPLLHLSRLKPDASEQELRNFLGGFGFAGDMALATVENFSGGEKTRLVLAMLVFQRPNLLLLDEPTNHLDLEMRHALTIALQTFSGAILMISHDPHLLRSVTDLFLLVDQGNVSPFDGDIEDYHKWLKSGDGCETEKEMVDSGPSKKEQRQLAAEMRKKSQPLTQKIKKLEKELEKLHSRESEITGQLAEPEIYEERNKEKLTGALKEKGTLEQQIEEIELNWFELNEELEALMQQLSN
ncbi:MAG: ATP-binding cassette domain-containing protein [Gammaproteobacteria bacterium]|nr:ATP-binding cassette domain-containing protein [Gammaproteobacteria bacterium]